MIHDALEPYGAALLAHFCGALDAELIIRRDDGFEGRLPLSHFFREPAAFTPIENAALARCSGRVLDVGAGTGLHSLALQAMGLRVTALDIRPEAVEIMRPRGVHDAQCGDVFAYEAGPFDTILLLGHGVGMVETIAGLDRFLAHATKLLPAGGRLLLDSLDVRETDSRENLAYHEANREAGRYIGETRIQFEYQGKAGPFCGWLHVDAGTLAGHAIAGGWSCEVILTGANGEYLAQLTRPA